MTLNRLMLAMALAAALIPAAGHAAAPDPARCPRTPPIDPELNNRKGVLPVPASMAAIARSGRTSLAVATLNGTNFCHDITSISQAEDFTLSADKRFFAFHWFGYEESGHIVIDRSGRGMAVDTGARPVFSPSRRLMTAIEYSESGFGSLNGFAIWQVNPVGVRRTVFLDSIPSLVDWRVDGWVGETCINLSGVPNSRIPDSGDYSKVARDRYAARPSGASWRITRSRC